MKRLLFLCAIILLLPLLIGGGRYALFLRQKVAPPEPVTVSVPRGASFAAVAQKLRDSEVISSATCFKILGRLRGDARGIHAGDYYFAEENTPGRILDRLLAGDVLRLQLTIPEGLHLKEIAQRLQQSEFKDVEAFLPLTRDADWIRSLGIEAETLEGYLFPETYTINSQTSSRRLIRAMVAQLQKQLTEDLLAKAKEQGLDRHQFLTLASIVQKEAGSDEEMPIIAAVFHNRLRLGMPLQADPTVIYGIEDFAGNITRRHLREHTPYNTYRIPGLPPGPIANPGRSALQATANPAPVDYLYFVSRGDGSHQFSKTLAEHNAAVRRYILNR